MNIIITLIQIVNQNTKHLVQKMSDKKSEN